MPDLAPELSELKEALGPAKALRAVQTRAHEQLHFKLQDILTNPDSAPAAAKLTAVAHGENLVDFSGIIPENKELTAQLTHWQEVFGAAALVQTLQNCAATLPALQVDNELMMLLPQLPLGKTRLLTQAAAAQFRSQLREINEPKIQVALEKLCANYGTALVKERLARLNFWITGQKIDKLIHAGGASGEFTGYLRVCNALLPAAVGTGHTKK